MQRKRLLLLTLLAALVLGLLPSAALAGDTTTTAPESTDSSVGSPVAPLLAGKARTLADGAGVKARIEAIDDYWTPGRMRSAIPADRQPGLPKLSKPAPGEAPDDVERPDGPAGKVAPAQPSAFAPLPLRPRVAPPGGITADSWNWGGSQYSAPARLTGKVYFTKVRTNGTVIGNYVCSGSTVNSPSKNIVWSAGHCVHGGDGGTWHRNWVFVPAKRDSSEPYGRWYAKQQWTLNNWIDDSSRSSDMGAVVMWPRSGTRIVDRLGGQGISWNYSKSQVVLALGYPAASPFDGQKLIACYDQMWSDVWSFWSHVGIECDMNGGSSGGPWLRAYSGGYGYINGINSFKYSWKDDNVYSPYFGDKAETLYNAVKYL